MRSRSFIHRIKYMQRIGMGGTSVIFRATTDGGRDFALKRLRNDRISPGNVKRFKKEAHVLGKLNSPNIVRLMDCGLDSSLNPDQDTFFILMDFVEGQPLDRIIDNRHIPIGEALQIGIQITHALDATHKAGFVHRDIKPENLIILESGRVVVIDFGIVFDPNDDELRELEEGFAIGSPLYMSPEQGHMKVNPTSRTDVYSLGVVMFEMLTDEVPFRGVNAADVVRAQISDKVPRFSDVVSLRFPDGLERLIRQTLEKNPENRPDVLEFRQRLEYYASRL